jgi:DNA invertase Pin-like site-specific DNA recombinase
MKSAYSYIRFSTPEQAKGDSFRRQTEAADKWALENGYQILNRMKDLGVSAFRGKNLKEGPLAEFLARVRAGRIANNSVLIVESLDRISRDEVIEVLPDFLNLIKAGLGVVTLTDCRLYTRESVRDPTQLIGSLIVMTRAHEESVLKSGRLSDVWGAKLDRARKDPESKLTDRVPAWLEVVSKGQGRDKQRIFVPEQTRVELVRRIFRETVEGYGRRLIARRLNCERPSVRPFRSVRGWQPSTIAKIISSRAVLGEYQPHKRGRDGKRVADRDGVIKNYYPAIIDEGLFIAANNAVRARLKNAAGRPEGEPPEGGKAREGEPQEFEPPVAHLLRGLARCQCGARMDFLNKGAKGGCYYQCSNAARRAGCSITRLWKAELAEQALLHQIGPIGLRELVAPAEPRSGPTAQDYEKRIEDLRHKKRRGLDRLLERDDPDTELLVEGLSREIADLEKRRDASAKAERSKPDLPATESAFAAVAAFAQEMEKSDGKERARLRRMIMQQLRAAFSELRFSEHRIDGLIPLPGKPPMKTAIGLPRPIEVKIEDHDFEKLERYYLRHMIYCDDPDYLASLADDGSPAPKGVFNARYTERV